MTPPVLCTLAYLSKPDTFQSEINPLLKVVPKNQDVSKFYIQPNDKQGLVDRLSEISFAVLFFDSFPVGKYPDSVNAFTVITLHEIRNLTKGNPEHFMGFLRARCGDKRGFVVKLIHNAQGSVTHLLTGTHPRAIINIAALANAQFVNKFPRDLDPWSGETIYTGCVKSGFALIQFPDAKLVGVNDERYNTMTRQFNKAIKQIVDELNFSQDSFLPRFEGEFSTDSDYSMSIVDEVKMATI